MLNYNDGLILKDEYALKYANVAFDFQVRPSKSGWVLCGSSIEGSKRPMYYSETKDAYYSDCPETSKKLVIGHCKREDMEKKLDLTYWRGC